MRILVLSNSDSGLFQFRKEIISRLCDQNDVTCCCPNTDGFKSRIEALGCKCIITDFDRRAKNPIKDMMLLVSYLNIINTIRPDIVFTYTIKPNIYGGIICRIKRINYYTNITGLGTAIENPGVLNSVLIMMYKVALGKAKLIVFQNRNNLLYFKTKGIVKDNYLLLPGSGVNLEDFKYEDYPDHEGIFSFLFVGRIMKDKGIEELLEAICFLQKERQDIRLDVVGRMEEDYSIPFMELEEKGLLKYYGQQNNIQQFYKTAQCVVLPSYHEGMSNVLLEASSTGRPIISTNVPGCIETFEEGITGFGCEAKNVDSLVLAMKKILSLSNEQRKKMGIEARKKMENEFDRNKIISTYCEIVSNVQ